MAPLFFLVLSKPTSQKKYSRKPNYVSVRCEQSSQESNGLDVWLGRFAMVGFAVAISVEVATGKGLLEVWPFFLIEIVLGISLAFGI